jgi:glycosyltransferase involved in cell wall biosynthesis
MPDAAIVIPCFNQAHYVAQAVSSALDQTRRDLEIIVVDDGSTDDVATALRPFSSDPRCRIIRQENAGVGAARNRGLAVVSAPFVMFLDADDYLHRDKIARQLDVFERDPAIDVVLCDIAAVEGPLGSDTVTVNTERLELDDLLTALLAGGLFPPCVPLIRTACVRAAGEFHPDRSLAGHADYLLWLQLGARGVRHAMVHEKLAYYRLRPDGMSQDRDHMAGSRQRALAEIAAHYPEPLAAALCRLGERHHDAWHAARWMREAMGRVTQHSDTLTQNLAVLTQNQAALTQTLAATTENLTATTQTLAATTQNLTATTENLSATMQTLTATTADLVSTRAALDGERGARDRAEQRIDLLEGLVAHRQKSVVIWGCGAGGREALAYLRTRGISVEGWLDSNSALHGTRLEGIPVHNPHLWIKAARDERPLIVIASVYAANIRSTLDTLATQRGTSIDSVVF